MNFAYKSDGTVAGLNRVGQGEELTGTCMPQELVWGMVNEYYTAPGGVLAPVAPEIKELNESLTKKSEVLRKTLNAIDTKTNQLIETSWIYPDADGQQIRLTSVDQVNYEGEKNLYAELDYDGIDITPFFPLDVKVWTGPSGEPIMVSMADLAAYKTFIRAGKSHIRAKLQEGWLLKNSLIAMSLDELEAWEDPR